MRPQRRETAHRPGTGTLPPMERQPRRPPHLGTAPAHRINPAQITPAPAWPPRTATSALGMPSHRTSEYLRLDHEILLGILAEKIHDQRFLRLIRHMLKAGYLEDWEHHETLSGCPQGGVVSPILSNIYLHKLDEFAERELIPQYTRGA